jgi:hypothetical protein
MPANGLSLALHKNRAAAGGGVVFPLDTLVSQGASIIAAYSVRRLLTSYTGVCGRLRGNGSGSPEADIPFTVEGWMDMMAAEALIASGGGTAGFWVNWKDQAGSFHASNATASTQPRYSFDPFLNPSIGGTAVTNAILAMNLGTLSDPLFFQIVIARFGTVSKHLFATTSATTTPTIRVLMNRARACFGSTIDGTIPLTSTSRIGVLSHGANSKIYVNETLDVTGNAGGGTLDYSNARFGRASDSSGSNNSWFQTSNNRIYECVIFQGNPTGLAGWSDFVTTERNAFL